ncbi:major paralogous domain-containing protein, partial [Fibrobacter sp. UWH5]
MNLLRIFCLALFAMFFTACGGDSGSGASDEISVNSSDDEGLDAASSTSVTAGEAKESKKSSSSKGSSAKSSESAASSSSVIPGTDRGSSSSGAASSSSTFVYHMCESGDTLSFMDDLSCMVYFSCVDFEWNIDSTICAPKPKVYPNMDRQFDTEYDPVYGEFTDPRDGQVYKTVVLYESYQSENTIEVFAQNLNYGEMVDSSVHRLDDGKVEKYCELNDEWFCENGWGGRYTWSEAMGISSKYDSVLW